MTDNANVGQKRPADANVRTSKRKRRRITATTPMVSVYEDEILEQHQQGRKPKQIAQSLSVKHGLAKGDLTPRAVSDKIGRMIKQGFIAPSPTNPCTGLRAEPCSQRPACTSQRSLFWRRLTTLRVGGDRARSCRGDSKRHPGRSRVYQ